MDGLTNIIAKIENLNNEECASVLASAKAQAERIHNEAVLCAEKEVNDINALAQKKIDVINAKAVSSSELEYKRVILSKKSEMMECAIKKALESISNSDDKTYFDYIKKLVLSNAISGNGTLKMSKSDVCRMPDGFVGLINAELPGDKTIDVSDEDFVCDGGFVIDYPEIRIDCTFNSLVEDKADEIRDEINRVLFS